MEKFHLLSHYILNDFVLFCLFHAACSFNFEDGIGGWEMTGRAFIYQPTFGDNSAARNRESAQQQGNWWIGGAENRPSESISPGAQHPDGSDAPSGTITSPWFRIVGENISFLIGGGCNVTVIRAELIVNNQVSTIELITFFLYFNSSFFCYDFETVYLLC